MTFPAYTPKTPEELKKLAVGMITGNLMTSDEVLDRDPGLMGMVFMPLAFMPDDERQHWKDQGVTMFFEWIDKALPRAINGLPIFMSIGMLSSEEHKRIYTIAEELREALNNVKP